MINLPSFSPTSFLPTLFSQVALVVVVHMLGYYIFRSANSEKDAFRRDPEDPAVRHLRCV